MRENPQAWPCETARPQAELAFEAGAGGRTHLGRSRTAYPFHVGRQLDFPDDPRGMAAVYLQSCSGGLFEHERLALAIRAGPHAKVHVTTGASTVVHAMRRGEARQAVLLAAEPDSLLEYMPEAIILFPTARLAASLTIRLAPRALVLAADTMLLHDPTGSGQRFGWYETDTRIEADDGTTLARDRQRLEGAWLARPLPGVLGKWRMQGTFFVAGLDMPAERYVSVLRNAISDCRDIHAGVSRLPNGCGAWMRVLAADAVALRTGMQACWRAMRECLTGRSPVPRRR